MNIGIVSLGLIGGSILKSLNGKGHKLYAVSRNKNTILSASTYANCISEKMEILKECDVVFVASPINKTLEVLDELEKYLKSDCIVMDCASVKEFVMKKRPYKFIGSHPMAGKENSGYEFSDGELFKSAIWVLTPFNDTLTEDIKKAENIIKLTGAKTIITNAKEHDRAAALISHFPMIVSMALFYSIKDNNLAKLMAASGFRDMTRLAMSNTEMAVDMLNFNAENIDFSAKELYKSIEFIKNTKDLKIFADIKSVRSKMYSKEGKNILISS